MEEAQKRKLAETGYPGREVPAKSQAVHPKPSPGRAASNSGALNRVPPFPNNLTGPNSGHERRNLACCVWPARCVLKERAS